MNNPFKSFPLSGAALGLNEAYAADGGQVFWPTNGLSLVGVQLILDDPSNPPIIWPSGIPYLDVGRPVKNFWLNGVPASGGTLIVGACGFVPGLESPYNPQNSELVAGGPVVAASAGALSMLASFQSTRSQPGPNPPSTDLAVPYCDNFGHLVIGFDNYPDMPGLSQATQALGITGGPGVNWQQANKLSTNRLAVSTAAMAYAEYNVPQTVAVNTTLNIAFSAPIGSGLSGPWVVSWLPLKRFGVYVDLPTAGLTLNFQLAAPTYYGAQFNILESTGGLPAGQMLYIMDGGTVYVHAGALTGITAKPLPLGGPFTCYLNNTTAGAIVVNKFAIFGEID